MQHDRGATLFEMLVVLMLTTLTASALLTVVTGSAHSVGRFSEFDPRVHIAAESLTRDLRDTTDVEVVAHDGMKAIALDLVTTEGPIRWSADGRAAINRTAADGSQATLLDGLSPTKPVSFELFTRSGKPISPGDVSAVETCTARIAIEVTGADGIPLHNWSVSMRLFGDERASC